jgi:hypothetical protein
MATSPVISTPSRGGLLAPSLGYVERRSAEHQADMWNEALAGDFVLGPSSGFKVGVGATSTGCGCSSGFRSWTPDGMSRTHVTRSTGQRLTVPTELAAVAARP